MPETITLHALDLSGETTLKLFLRKDDGSLLNTGGDELTEISSSGVFQATLAESRSGLGVLNARVCLGTETADNLVYDDSLPESSTVLGAKVNAVLDTPGRLAIWNVLSTESFTADSMGARLLISDGTNGRQVKVTGANHVAADVHECQADGLSASTEITAINTFATRVTTGLVSDGPVWQFTANMLELGPAGGGGGGTDWTADERTAIRSILGIPGSGTTPTNPSVGILDTIRDLVTAYIAAALATVNGTSGTIVGFPATLNIGDSYTDDCNSAIHVFIRDSNDDPITAVGTHEFTDADFAPECIITLNGNTGRVKCDVEYVTASPENYLKIQIPMKESRRATPGIATVQVLLKWDGAQKALSKQAVTWEALI